MRVTHRCAVIAVCVLAFAGPARSALVTWQIHGNVREILTANAPYQPVNDPGFTSLGVVPGAPYSLTVLLDSSSPDGDPSPTFGEYDAAVLQVDLQIASYGRTYGPFTQQFARVNLDAGEFFILNAYGVAPGQPLSILGLEVYADVVGTFPTDALPVNPPPVENLHPYERPDSGVTGFGSYLVVFDKTGAGADIQIDSDILGWVLVPEPESLALFAAALSLAFARLRDARR